MSIPRVKGIVPVSSLDELKHYQSIFLLQEQHSGKENYVPVTRLKVDTAEKNEAGYHVTQGIFEQGPYHQGLMEMHTVASKAITGQAPVIITHQEVEQGRVYVRPNGIFY